MHAMCMYAYMYVYIHVYLYTYIHTHNCMDRCRLGLATATLQSRHGRIARKPTLRVFN